MSNPSPNSKVEAKVEELRVELFNLPAEARATVDFGGLDRARWTLGPRDLFTGFCFESGVGGGLTFRDLTLKQRVLTLMPTQAIACIRFQLHVALEALEGAPLIGGSVDVRGGAHVRFTSRFDCITILGHSSWYIRMA